MDACGTVVLGWLVIYGICKAVESREKSQKEKKAKEAAARALAIEQEAREADERFLREHPDAWLARQRAGLERERLAAIKKYAGEESGRQSVGLAAGIIRAFLK